MRHALLLLSACALTAEPGGPSEREFEAIDGMRALAEDAGWTVQEGVFGFQELAFCCEPFVHCGGVDPGATIGTYSLPKAPGQDAPIRPTTPPATSAFRPTRPWCGSVERLQSPTTSRFAPCCRREMTEAATGSGSPEPWARR